MVHLLLFKFACLWLYWKLHIFQHVCLLLYISYFVNHLFMSFAHLSSLVLNVFIIIHKTINPMSCGLQTFFLAFSFQLWFSFLFYLHIFLYLFFCLKYFCTQLLSMVCKALGGLAPCISPLAILPTKIHVLDTLNYLFLQMQRSSLILLRLNTSAQNAFPAPINQDNV